jgi:hypothetical protein
MVFRRRDPRSLWRVAAESVYPRGGWRRSLEYVKHRLRRLPDSPEKIGRGMAAGVLISFTPFYGFHFLGGLLIAWAIRGNLLASVIGTFANNFVTLVPISAMAVTLGYWILGKEPGEELVGGLGHAFGEAWNDLWHNFWAIFGPESMEWGGFAEFLRDVFWPYLVGGIGPGLLAAVVSYWVTVPLVGAYQAARRRRLEERLASRLRAPGAGPERE